MSESKELTSASKELTVAERAVLAIGKKDDEPRLIALAESTKDIVAITNTDGYKQVHAARMVLKNERLDITKDARKARDDAVAFSKACVALEKRLIGLIEPEETRLENLQKTWDDARDAERQAKIEIELRRVSDLQKRVAELRSNGILSPTSGSALIAQHIADLEAIAVDEKFEEFRQQAQDAKDAGLKRLQDLHSAALAHEAEQERIRHERAELARLRAEEEMRTAAERARLAEEERQAKAARDAEDARHAQEVRLNQMRMSEISGIQQQPMIAEIGRTGVRVGGTLECIKETLAETEAWPIEESNFGPLTAIAQSAKETAVAKIRESLAAFERRQAQESRLAAERDGLAAEERRLADERAAIADRELKVRVAEERRVAAEKAEAERRAQEEAERRARAERRERALKNPPAAAEIAEVLAEHYEQDLDVVCEWLRHIDFRAMMAEVA